MESSVHGKAVFILRHQPGVLAFSDDTLKQDPKTEVIWSGRTYPAPLGVGGVGSIPANSDAQNVPAFRRWRFEMKLSPFWNETEGMSG
jgi:hypothetical protein